MPSARRSAGRSSTRARSAAASGIVRTASARGLIGGRSSFIARSPVAEDDARFLLAQDPLDGGGDVARGVGGRASARVDVGDNLAIGVGGPGGRLVDVIGGERIGEAEARAL